MMEPIFWFVKGSAAIAPGFTNFGECHCEGAQRLKQSPRHKAAGD
jgi:hypothetical protein